jgi:hypothetical protein
MLLLQERSIFDFRFWIFDWGGSDFRFSIGEIGDWGLEVFIDFRFSIGEIGDWGLDVFEVASGIQLGF